METVITALISAAAAIIVCIINANANHKKLMTELEKHDEMHDYRLKQLELKVDKHNNLVERTYHLEEGQKLLEEKVSVANHRIKDLEAKG